MDAKEILTKAIDKAIENGYITDLFAWIPADKDALLNYWLGHDLYKSVMYSHDFAKALWPVDGEIYHVDPKLVNPQIGDWYSDEQEQVPTELWQKRLMEMVIAPDPITYLGEHL